MGVKYFCDACGHETKDDCGRNTSFGYQSCEQEKRREEFLNYPLICERCINRFHEAINATVVMVKNQIIEEKGKC